MPSSHLILCHPLFLLPPVPPSIRVFSNESTLRMRWPKYWSFSFSISPPYEYTGLISFMNDWFDLLAVQGTLKSLLQHHSLKASILWHTAFFMVQLLTSVHDSWKNHSFDYMDLLNRFYLSLETPIHISSFLFLNLPFFKFPLRLVCLKFGVLL